MKQPPGILGPPSKERTPGGRRRSPWTGRILRGSARAGLSLICLAGGCSVNTNPELPTWEAEFNVPLGMETTFLSEWVDESDDLVEDPSGVVAFCFEGAVERTEIGDRLTVDPIQASFHPTIGAFELDAPAPQETELLFGDLWPPSQALDGQAVPVPGFEFQEIEATVPEPGGFSSMTLEEGGLKTVISNDLPVAIENIRLDLIDGISSALIASVDFPSIPAGQTDSSTTDLSGKTLTHDLRIRASGDSEGSHGGAVMIDDGDGVTLGVTLDNLRAIGASAELPSTEIEHEETAGIPEGMILTEAEIARGGLHLEIDNDLPVPLMGSLEIGELRDPTGVPLRASVNLPAEGQRTSVVDLGGYTLVAALPPPGESQVLHIRATVTTEETGEIVTLEAGDGLTVDALFDTLSFARVSGILDSTAFELSPTTQEVDVPGDLDGISLEQARLTLKLMSSISIPLHLSMEAIGRSDKGTVVILPIEVDIGQAAKSESDTTMVILDQNNSTIVNFLNNLPSTVSVSGEARAGDGHTPGTVSQTDYVEGTFEFEVPLHLSFEEQEIESDLTEIEILPENGDADGGDNAVDGELSARMRAAEIWVTFVNHTAVGVVATANFAMDSTRVFSDPDFALDPVELNPGICDETGVVVEAVRSQNSLALTYEDLDLFRNPGGQIKIVYMGTTLRLLSTEGRSVKVCSSDYIQTQARIRFTAAVEMPEDK